MSSSSNTRPELRLDWCSAKAAKYACEKWHYSRSVFASKNVYVGVWEGGQFIGCVVFARGANNSLGKPFGLPQNEVCELVRVALGGHAAPVSKIVSIAIRILKKQSPGLKLIVSYADKNYGHHGGIYQAMNWVYVGTTSKDFCYITHDGRRLHSREVSESGFKKYFGEMRKVPKPSECKEKVLLLPKHKYLYPLTPEMRAKIEPLAQPYPKRALDKGNDPDQGNGGGAIPTRALQ